MTRAEFTAKWQPVLTVAGGMSDGDWAELMADFDSCFTAVLERHCSALEKSAERLGHDAARRILKGHARALRHLFEENPF
jgi:hypothetical protein